VLSAVVEKAAVTVNSSISSLSENLVKKIGPEFGGEIRSRRSLDAMNRPQNLRYFVQLNYLAWNPLWMVSSETPVIGWMPILSGENEVEFMFLHHPVYHRNHLVPVGHGQCPTRQKVILHVDDQKCVHRKQNLAPGQETASKLVRTPKRPNNTQGIFAGS
jgi:hypothetical protein